MFKKILTVFVLLGFITISNNIAASAASKLEPYQKLIQSRNFTVKYETVTKTPNSFVENQEALFDADKLSNEKINWDERHDIMDNKAYFINYVLFPDEIIVPQSKYKRLYEFQKKMHKMLSTFEANSKGIAVVSDNKMYAECANDNIGAYFYSVDGKSLDWKKISYNKKPYYTEINKMWYGGNKFKAKYKDYDIESEVNYGINLGNVVVTRYLHAILPAQDHPMTIPVFTFVKSTNEYEEYYSDDGSLKEVVRYYFNDGVLSKIMAMAVKSNVNNSTEVGQYIVNINEFTGNVDSKYFTLPDYIIAK